METPTKKEFSNFMGWVREMRDDYDTHYDETVLPPPFIEKSIAWLETFDPAELETLRTENAALKAGIENLRQAGMRKIGIGDAQPNAFIRSSLPEQPTELEALRAGNAELKQKLERQEEISIQLANDAYYNERPGTKRPR